jgi:hypothetical protein
MDLKTFLRGLYHSFPVQLLVLHLRKYQVLLVCWFILFSTVRGDFMSTFGADSLFLAPEYLGAVNFLSAGIVGVATGIFIMSWHITTFILHSRHFKFLATTSKPFLKYFINNSIIPLAFLVFYLINAVQFDRNHELMGTGDILVLVAGFLLGLILIITVSLSWFFGAERTMMRKMQPVLDEPHKYMGHFGLGGEHHHEQGLIQIDWFLNTRFKLKRPRNIKHYPVSFIDTVFKRHHFSAVLSIILAFLFLAMIGMFQDVDVFVIPAAAAILLLFSILIAGSGAMVYWLKSWSFPALILIFLVFEMLFRFEWIDPRNKAYGLNYGEVDQRPTYQRDSILALCSPERMKADSLNMIGILEQWKAKQGGGKPLLYVINVSGGGTRSATFSVNVMQRLDSLMKGQLMKKTFLITGASGGMLGAAWYRELYRQQINGASPNLGNTVPGDAISRDLLNPLFSSMVMRDLFAPAQQFKVGGNTYVKDRGYAFERQLNRNTFGILDHQLKDYVNDESMARIPLMLFSSTVTRDGRKMMICSQPVSFMMRNHPDSAHGMPGEPDAIDFGAFFHRQDPYALRMLSTLRINATFPYVLPNVWLPTDPVVDVMDAGIRDNYGQESMVRFLHVFREWLGQHTGGVVFIQIRDRRAGEWEGPGSGEGLVGLFTKPMTVIQYNWMKMQDYYQDEMVNYAGHFMGLPLRKLSFNYVPSRKSSAAALNFHLTAKEKNDIFESIRMPENDSVFRLVPGLESGHSPKP